MIVQTPSSQDESGRVASEPLQSVPESKKLILKV